MLLVGFLKFLCSSDYMVIYHLFYVCTNLNLQDFPSYCGFSAFELSAIHCDIACLFLPRSRIVKNALKIFAAQYSILVSYCYRSKMVRLMQLLLIFFRDDMLIRSSIRKWFPCQIWFWSVNKIMDTELATVFYKIEWMKLQLTILDKIRI